MVKSYKRKKEYSDAEKFAYHTRVHNEENLDSLKRAYSDGWLYAYQLGIEHENYIKKANAMAKGQTIGFYTRHKRKKGRK